MVRLVATDLDGTLLRSDGTLSSRTVAALRAAEDAGLTVVMVTARPLRWMEDLWAHVAGHGLAIVSNGAIVYDVAAGVREVTGIDPADGLPLAERIRAEVPGVAFGLEDVGGLRLERAFAEPHHIPTDSPVGPLEEVWELPAVKLMVRHADLPDQEFRERVIAAVGSSANATWSVSDLIEISAPGVDKATTLTRLAADLSYAAADCAAVGDMPNDLPMIGWAGLGCAVGNAHADVLAAADRVLPRNDEDGVAVLIEELLAR